MGLDMYLSAEKTSFETHFDMGRNERLLMDYPEELKVFANDIEKRNFKSCSVEFGVGYWRKFNALHGYIVNNYADGEDNCRKIALYKEHIADIIKDLERIREDHSLAKEIMPPTSGFFFGSDEIDDWYWEDIEYTYDLFKKVYEIADEYDIVYRASW